MSKFLTFWKMFLNFQSHDNQPHMNLYGSHPFFLYSGPSSPSFGVFLLNSNAMSVRTEFNNQNKYLQYQVIGGVLDFYFFLGPSSQDVIQQYHSIIGKPYLPPKFALGFHQCRWGYNSLDEIKKVVAGYEANNLPLDAIWTDIDYMDKYRDFTFDPDRFPIQDMIQFVSDLHKKGKKYILIVDPGIPVVNLNQEKYEPLELGLSLDIFIKNGNNNSYVNRDVWPGQCYFPDMTNPKFKDYFWKPLIHKFLSTLNIDGLWTDMNEPAVLKTYTPNQNKWNYPPFVPRSPAVHDPNEPIFHRTIDMDSRMHASIHYNVHNLYSHLESIATSEALQDFY